jgi:hypothetical protein
LMNAGMVITSSDGLLRHKKHARQIKTHQVFGKMHDPRPPDFGTSPIIQCRDVRRWIWEFGTGLESRHLFSIIFVISSLNGFVAEG